VTGSASKALFLDRDGVINHETDYLYRITDVRWVEGIFPLCTTAQRLGYKLVVITNQSGIARGLYTESDFHTLMDWMRAEFLARNINLDAVYFCPYHPEGVGTYKREHPDRKPAPGMLLRAARDLSLDLARSVLVGDRCSDIAAANAAGLAHAFILRGTESKPCHGAHQVVGSLAAVEAWFQSLRS
jgi:D-glycero-D-manno-heptose 1,7-bisphosphate phosphatase